MGIFKKDLAGVEATMGSDKPVAAAMDSSAAGADAIAVVTVDPAPGADMTASVTVMVNGEKVEALTGERPDDAHPGTQMPLPVPPGGWPPDEFSGLAGKFVRDPFTGVRSRAVE